MIPLFISCLVLSFVGFFPIYKVLTICLGVSQFFPPPYPKTMWYFSMIIFFYILTPIIHKQVSKGIMIGLLTCILIFLFLLVGIVFFHFDTRLADYFIFYALPFLLRNSNNIMRLFAKRWCFTLVIPAFTILYVTFKNPSWEVHFITNVCISLIILLLSNLISMNLLLSNFFSVIAYGSMFAYLYHRELFIVIHKVIGDFYYTETIISILILFVLSYFGQKIYDNFIKNSSLLKHNSLHA